MFSRTRAAAEVVPGVPLPPGVVLDIARTCRALFDRGVSEGEGREMVRSRGRRRARTSQRSLPLRRPCWRRLYGHVELRSPWPSHSSRSRREGLVHVREHQDSTLPRHRPGVSWWLLGRHVRSPGPQPFCCRHGGRRLRRPISPGRSAGGGTKGVLGGRRMPGRQEGGSGDGSGGDGIARGQAAPAVRRRLVTATWLGRRRLAPGDQGRCRPTAFVLG